MLTSQTILGGMNMARIGVEPVLSNVKTALEQAGHEVVDLHTPDDAANCDCCVITGLDKDMMGIHDTVLKGPVINASGESPEAVMEAVENRLS
jgi:hypothetical protein